MDTSKILTADLLDLIFNDRNKLYGAYELRKTYPSRVKKALIITFTMILSIISVALLGGSFKSVAKLQPDSREVIITQIDDDKKPPPIVEPPPKQTQVVHTEKLTTFKMVEAPSEPPPTTEDLSTAKIGDSHTEGPDDIGLTSDPGPKDNTGIIEPPVTAEPEIYTHVQVEAKFTGNWEKFLLRNLRPDVPIDNGAPAGRYSVLVEFVVDKEGNVSNIRTLSNVGYGMEEEAVRVLKKAEKWEPAIQNGYKVKAYRRQMITFEVQGE